MNGPGSEIDVALQDSVGVEDAVGERPADLSLLPSAESVPLGTPVEPEPESEPEPEGESLSLKIGDEVVFLGYRWRAESAEGSLLTVRCLAAADDGSIDALEDAAKALLERVRRMRNGVIVRLQHQAGGKVHPIRRSKKGWRK